MRIVRSMKEITGIEPPVSSEWDAGWIGSHPRARISVRKEPDCWIVLAAIYRGIDEVTETEIASCECETCAKALALNIAYPNRRVESACGVHGETNPSLLFDATRKVLLSLLGLTSVNFLLLEDGPRHRIDWVVRLVLDGEVSWEDVTQAWGRATESLSVAISGWIARLNLMKS